MSFDKSQVYNYLGYRQTAPDPAILALIEQCLDEIANFKAHYVYQIYEIAVNGKVELLGIETFDSKNLANHLRGCDKVAILAATLGAEADLRLNKYNKIDVAKAVVFDACCNAYVEYVCDNVEQEIKSNQRLSGYISVSRFSPGYGDFSLAYQTVIMALLQCQKNIGLTLSQDLLLVPTKSVTALVGFTPNATREDAAAIQIGRKS
ncbi:MAG: Vitamin B12 dependent methionine synthase activation subunit [Clostridiales bacterium]|jgi:hypothetical protein|nr:Vitamin B12 dependent methionine synthase activation subunit [Clostridiales bacterium]